MPRLTMTMTMTTRQGERVGSGTVDRLCMSVDKTWGSWAADANNKFDSIAPQGTRDWLRLLLPPLPCSTGALSGLSLYCLSLSVSLSSPVWQSRLAG